MAGSKLESLIKMIYRGFRRSQGPDPEEHPDEEALACFCEGRLEKPEEERVKEHLLRCSRCAEAVAIALGPEPLQLKELPERLLERARAVSGESRDLPELFEIILRLKEDMLELLDTTGAILMGQELIPVPVLRSRSIKQFKDEVTILKDFKDLRIEARIVNKSGKEFNVAVSLKENVSQRLVKDLRVTLIREGVELESYLAGSGSVVFEHVALGRYRVDIANIRETVASLLLDIRR